MFKDKIEGGDSRMSWDAIKGIDLYFGESIMLILIIGSVLYLIVKVERNHVRNKILSYYLCIIMVLFAPYVGNLLGKLVGKEVLWRMGWLLIVPIVLAYSYTHWIYSTVMQKKAVKTIVKKGIFAVIVIGLLWSGKEYLFTKHRFTFEHNIYKIDDESIQVADYLVEEGELYILATPELASQIRQYEPRIHSFSGRWPNNENKNSIYAHIILNREVVDIAKLMKRCKEQKCEILILKDEVLTDSMESVGASLMKEIGGYKIYRIVI